MSGTEFNPGGFYVFVNVVAKGRGGFLCLFLATTGTFIFVKASLCAGSRGRGEELNVVAECRDHFFSFFATAALQLFVAVFSAVRLFGFVYNELMNVLFAAAFFDACAALFDACAALFDACAAFFYACAAFFDACAAFFYAMDGATVGRKVLRRQDSGSLTRGRRALAGRVGRLYTAYKTD